MCSLNLSGRYNQIQKIENLPSKLNEFWCGGNQIKKIENLPKLLTEFWCGPTQNEEKIQKKGNCS